MDAEGAEMVILHGDVTTLRTQVGLLIDEELDPSVQRGNSQLVHASYWENTHYGNVVHCQSTAQGT